MKNWVTGFTFLCLLLLPRCQQAKQYPAQGTAVPTGKWGNKNLAMEISESGATLEGLCMSGKILLAIPMDDSGEFIVDGEYGVHLSQYYPRPTRFSGRVDSELDSLSLVAVTIDEHPTTFFKETLKRNQGPEATYRCSTDSGL